MNLESKTHIAVVGLGYVGLPLAVELGRQFPTIGFDILDRRVNQLQTGLDVTGELSEREIGDAAQLSFTSRPDDVRNCNVYIVTVPTPINEHKQPDFGPLISASRMIGSLLKAGDLVIYESTVYPGATEEVCVPELERASGMTLNEDFGVGYSPERINPGDKGRRLATIPKVTSGSNEKAAKAVDAIYGKIITAGTHPTSSIKVAEAAKVIENTQRDANIALINEFALIFGRLGIDTHEVLAAAATKWNFLSFKPGLVGGHCIGVDPYYLIQKAQSVGYYPDILLACRRINDAMGSHVASEIIKSLVKAGKSVASAKVLILGFSFKENCADTRNTRVIDLVRELESYSVQVAVHDPYAAPEDVKFEYGLDLITQPESGAYDAVVLAVAHDEYTKCGSEMLRAFGTPNSILYDVKGVLPRDQVDGRL